MSDSIPQSNPAGQPSSLLEGLSPKDLMADIMQPTQAGDFATALPPLSPEELAPHFPQLEILDCLGRGGMGVVYKARQKSLNRLVALKLLAPERVADATFAQRFTHEAQALAALNHPHIVTIHDFGQAGGYYFLLMEFVDGVNLRQAMNAGRFTPEQALAVVPPVCEALQYAHEHGIVHRDIKPENLLLDKDGRVKIADFGIARMLGAPTGQSAGHRSASGASEVARAEQCSAPQSVTAGTPQYMAPEQKAHRATDHRADIYSLGVVLYELLTGELPADKLQPPSRKVQIDVRLDEIVLRALETKPELRYQTAGEMRTQVETFTAGNSERETRNAEQPPHIVKAGTSLLTTPEQLATFEGQFFCFRTRGQLVLDDRQLTHSRAGMNTVIPLAAIRDLSVGKFPRTVNPAGLDLISVTFEEGGQRRRLLLSPMQGWFALPGTCNANVAEWFRAIRDAATVAGGTAPALTPPHQLGLPGSSLTVPLAGGLSAAVGLFLAWLTFFQSDGPPLLPTGIALVAIGFVPLLPVWFMARRSIQPDGQPAKPRKPAVLLMLLVPLNGAIVWAFATVARLLTDFFANPALAQRPDIDPSFTTKLANFLVDHPGIVSFVAILVSLVVDVLIIRRFWRAMHRPTADSGVSAPAATPAADAARLQTPAVNPTTKSAALLCISALLGGLIWLLSPQFTGHREPWDADSAYYWLSLVLAGFIPASFDAKRPLPCALGVWIGQVVAFLFLVLTSDQPGGLWVIGLVMLSFYSLLGLLGAMLGAGAHRLFRGYFSHADGAMDSSSTKLGGGMSKPQPRWQGWDVWIIGLCLTTFGALWLVRLERANFDDAHALTPAEASHLMLSTGVSTVILLAGAAFLWMLAKNPGTHASRAASAKRLLGRTIVPALAVVVLLRTFFVQPFEAATDAAAPEIPSGSCVLTWKLARDFAPGDLIVYRHENRPNVGRVTSSEPSEVLVNRHGAADFRVPRQNIVGKVISVLWLASVPSGVTQFDIVPVSVTENVVVVDVTTEVRRGNAELRAVLEGPPLPATTEAALVEKFSPPFTGTFVKPMRDRGKQPSRSLSPGRQTWRLGFVLPDAELAKTAFEDIRPIGPLLAVADRTVEGTLFEVRNANGQEFHATLHVAPPVTPADPKWVAVSGTSSYNESGGINMNWDVLASQPGIVFLHREGGQSTALLERDPKTKLYQTTVVLELTKAGTDRVLLVSRIGAVTAREELSGNLRDLSAELWSHKNLSATTVRGTEIELCRFQGKPITVQVPVLTSTVTPPAPVRVVNWSGAFVAIIGLCGIGGIVLLVWLVRKGGTACKVVAVLCVVPVLLLAVVLVGYLSMQAGRARDAEQKAMAAAQQQAIGGKGAANPPSQQPAPAPLIRRQVNEKTPDGRDVVMVFEELQRDEKTSTATVKSVGGGSVGAAMFVIRGAYDIAKARGAAYFINLKEWEGENGAQMYLIGFAPDKNVDPKTYFDLKEPLPAEKRLLFLSVSAYERLFKDQP